MSVALNELLNRAEHGKAGKRGFLRSVPRGLRGYNPYYDDNYPYDYEGKYRDKTELREGVSITIFGIISSWRKNRES